MTRPPGPCSLVVVLMLGGLMCFGAPQVRAEEPAAELPNASEWYDTTALYTILYQTGQLAKATDAARQAVDLAERLFGANDVRLAQSLNDLGALHQRQEQWDQAAACHERALQIRKAAQPTDPAAIVQSLGNLGKVYHAQGRPAQAKPLFEESLRLVEQHVGATHPKTVDSLRYLALIASGEADQDLADTLFLRAIAVLEGNRGQNQDALMAVLRDYADFLRSVGRGQEANAVDERLSAAQPPVTSPPAP